MEFAQILFGQPLPPAALPWRTPKVTCHAPGQVLTMIIDHRQRVACIHGNARCCCRPSLWPRCLPSEGFVAAREHRRASVSDVAEAGSLEGVVKAEQDQAPHSPLAP